MNLERRTSKYRWLCAFAAAALALSLVGCKEKPPAENSTAKVENPAEQAARKAQVAAAQQEQKADAERQKAEVAQKAAEAQKAAQAQKAADEKTAANEALANKVKSAILATPGLKNMAIDVQASDGDVTLFGTADNEAQRRKAGKVAAGVEGVKSLRNELKIVRGS